MKKIHLRTHRQLVAYRLPRTVQEQVKEELTVLNPVWLENRKMGRYNRGVQKYLFLYDQCFGSICLPIGYTETLMQKLTSEGLRFELHETNHSKPIRITFNGKLRDFQSNAMQKTLAYSIGTLEAPTGSGKTVMGLYAIAARRQKTIVVVHTKDLLHQWVERATSFLSVDKKEVGVIGDGRDKVGSRLTVATVQSLYSRAKQLNRTFGHLVVDECHRTPSRTFSEVVSSFCCMYQLGLTATANRRDNLERLIDLYIGPKRHSVSKKKMVDAGHILQANFVIRTTQFFSALGDPSSEYSKLLMELANNEERNTMICADISKQVFEGNTCLVLSDRKAHCYILKDMVFKRHNIYAECLTGDTPNGLRRDIIKRVNDSRCKLIIATGQLIGEGFDCKQLSTMFITTPIKFAGRVIQYIGRVLRPCKGKKSALVFDYADMEVDVLRRSVHSRIKVYGRKNVTWD